MTAGSPWPLWVTPDLLCLPSQPPQRIENKLPGCHGDSHQPPCPPSSSSLLPPDPFPQHIPPQC